LSSERFGWRGLPSVSLFLPRAVRLQDSEIFLFFHYEAKFGQQEQRKEKMVTESIKIDQNRLPRTPSRDLLSKSLDYSSYLTQQPRYVQRHFQLHRITE
jgi:hypothetical protein